jgi:hypothetical protein
MRERGGEVGGRGELERMMLAQPMNVLVRRGWKGTRKVDGEVVKEWLERTKDDEGGENT